MLNAVQAADPAGPVRVRVVADTLGPVFVPGRVELGHPVRIRVIDDGPGIAPEDIQPGALIHAIGTALRSTFVGFSIALVGVWAKAGPS